MGNCIFRHSEKALSLPIPVPVASMFPLLIAKLRSAIVLSMESRILSNIVDISHRNRVSTFLSKAYGISKLVARRERIEGMDSLWHFPLWEKKVYAYAVCETSMNIKEDYGNEPVYSANTSCGLSAWHAC